MSLPQKMLFPKLHQLLVWSHFKPKQSWQTFFLKLRFQSGSWCTWLKKTNINYSQSIGKASYKLFTEDILKLAEIIGNINNEAMISSHHQAFFLLILYFGWSLGPCCVDRDIPGYRWTGASMRLYLATSFPPGLWHVSAEPSSCSEEQLHNAANPVFSFWATVFTTPQGRLREFSPNSACGRRGVGGVVGVWVWGGKIVSEIFSCVFSLV